MKILAVTLRYPPYVAGGYERTTRDAVEGLRERGHEVAVLAGRGARLAGIPGVLPWLEPPLDGEEDPFQRALRAGNAERFRLHFFRPANHRAAAQALGAVRPDVVLFFNLGLVSLAPLLAFRLRGIPTLGYVGDPWPLNHWVRLWREDAAAAAAKPHRLIALERAWRSFRDTVGLGPLCACSDYLRRILVADGIPAEDLAVVPPNLQPEMAELARAARPRARETGEPLRVVCASSLWEGKGQAVLVEAAARVREGGVPIELVLAGDGEAGFRARLGELAAARGLAGAVRFTGRLELAELSREMAAAHVLAMPSLWGEPFGLATVEGMAHGLAVVASDAGASPELVADGVDGLLAPAGDAAALAAALARLAGDETLRRELGRRGRTRAGEGFSRAAFAARLEAALSAAGGGAG
ncbi:MAG: glycosyltransferase family 4 protein [Planctomycetota bacterium]